MGQDVEGNQFFFPLKDRGGEEMGGCGETKPTEIWWKEKRGWRGGQLKGENLFKKKENGGKEFA